MLDNFNSIIPKRILGNDFITGNFGRVNLIRVTLKVLYSTLHTNRTYKIRVRLDSINFYNLKHLYHKLYTY